MKIDLSQATFIIPIRIESPDRLRNVITTTAFLLEKLHLYKQEKGKAFSYFGTIAKRYLILYNNNNYKKLKQ